MNTDIMRKTHPKVKGIIRKAAPTLKFDKRKEDRMRPIMPFLQ